MEHTKHLWRAVLLIVVFAVAGVGARHFLVPETFGVQGFYRYGSLNDFMNKPVMHGDPAACASCHEEQADARKSGKHATVSCEVCHAPLAGHVAQEEKIADMPTNTSPNMCAYCHQKLRARPTDMPQIDFTEHLVSLEVLSKGDSIPDGACIVCHDVHNPGIE